MKKDEFMKQLQGCELPKRFDQHLLDHASVMFQRWGLIAHTSWDEDNREFLFKNFGLDDKSEDSQSVKDEKKALRCVISKMMQMQISKEDASTIIKNFNKINEQGFKGLE